MEWNPNTNEEDNYNDLLGKKVKKLFEGYGTFEGIIESYNHTFYWIKYADGDAEELSLQQVRV